MHKIKELLHLEHSDKKEETHDTKPAETHATATNVKKGEEHTETKTKLPDGGVKKEEHHVEKDKDGAVKEEHKEHVKQGDKHVGKDEHKIKETHKVDKDGDHKLEHKEKHDHKDGDHKIKEKEKLKEGEHKEKHKDGEKKVKEHKKEEHKESKKDENLVLAEKKKAHIEEEIKDKKVSKEDKAAIKEGSLLVKEDTANYGFAEVFPVSAQEAPHCNHHGDPMSPCPLHLPTEVYKEAVNEDIRGMHLDKKDSNVDSKIEQKELEHRREGDTLQANRQNKGSFASKDGEFISSPGMLVADVQGLERPMTPIYVNDLKSREVMAQDKEIKKPEGDLERIALYMTTEVGEKKKSKSKSSKKKDVIVERTLVESDFEARTPEARDTISVFKTEEVRTVNTEADCALCRQNKQGGVVLTEELIDSTTVKQAPVSREVVVESPVMRETVREVIVDAPVQETIVPAAFHGHNTAYDAALCNQCTGHQICSHSEKDVLLMKKMNEKKIQKDQKLAEKEAKKSKKDATHNTVV